MRALLPAARVLVAQDTHRIGESEFDELDSMLVAQDMCIEWGRVNLTSVTQVSERIIKYHFGDSQDAGLFT